MAEPLTLLAIADRLDRAIRMARGVEFAARGAGVDRDTTGALSELAARHTDELQKLADELEAQMEADREKKP
jgi:hypothetical protein